jgi:hypothetical protein
MKGSGNLKGRQWRDCDERRQQKWAMTEAVEANPMLSPH